MREVVFDDKSIKTYFDKLKKDVTVGFQICFLVAHQMDDVTDILFTFPIKGCNNVDFFDVKKCSALGIEMEQCLIGGLQIGGIAIFGSIDSNEAFTIGTNILNIFNKLKTDEDIYYSVNRSSFINDRVIAFFPSNSKKIACKNFNSKDSSLKTCSFSFADLSNDYNIMNCCYNLDLSFPIKENSSVPIEELLEDEFVNELSKLNSSESIVSINSELVNKNDKSKFIDFQERSNFSTDVDNSDDDYNYNQYYLDVYFKQSSFKKKTNIGDQEKLEGFMSFTGTSAVFTLFHKNDTISQIIQNIFLDLSHSLVHRLDYASFEMSLLAEEDEDQFLDPFQEANIVSNQHWNFPRRVFFKENHYNNIMFYEFGFVSEETMDESNILNFHFSNTEEKKEIYENIEKQSLQYSFLPININKKEIKEKVLEEKIEKVEKIEDKLEEEKEELEEIKEEIKVETIVKKEENKEVKTDDPNQLKKQQKSALVLIIAPLLLIIAILIKILFY
eukprot:TRINITY_DN13101_c0_g1_i1.p1 TRINITY_DN13101_c0_g1~~TRINITY_DN13101_c0_g1_i1.p1  ORF type:complete len:501 (+),score=150.56 TRINITY_DN13101_c0_g1_i1:97-1599(+)